MIFKHIHTLPKYFQIKETTVNQATGTGIRTYAA